MNLAKMTIKEIESIFAAGNVSSELLKECDKDSRKAVQRLIRRYEKEQQERQRISKLYAFEELAAMEGMELVAGVDEAGRGPLAGPVSVAAVILPRGLFLPKLNDSKKISAKVREELYEMIHEKAVAVGTSFVDAKTIDRVNIYQATINGMYEAIFSLVPGPQKVLIDAVPLDNLPMPSLSVVKGDEKSASIAAASIIAKVRRDRLMMEYDREYPEYGFARNKGYGTAEHIKALQQYGPCAVHRLSFEPVRSIALRHR